MTRLLLTALFWLLLISPSSALRLFAPEVIPTGYLENGQVKGLGVDILNEVIRRSGFDVDPALLVPYARAFEMLKTSDDVVVASLARTRSREDQYTWLWKLTDTHRFYVTGKDGPDLDHSAAKLITNIIVLRKSSLETELSSLGFENLTTATRSTDSLKMLTAGRVPVWYTSNLLLAGALKQSPSISAQDIHVGPPVGESVGIYAAASKNLAPEIREQLLKTFQIMVQDGTIRRIQEKYLAFEVFESLY